jgi:hypothetical protein
VAVAVVVLDIDGEDVVELPVVDDQDSVQQFAAEAADPPFGDRVGPRRRLHPISTVGAGGCG